MCECVRALSWERVGAGGLAGEKDHVLLPGPRHHGVNATCGWDPGKTPDVMYFP